LISARRTLKKMAPALNYLQRPLKASPLAPRTTGEGPPPLDVALVFFAP